jgi:hypothetical protein
MFWDESRHHISPVPYGCPPCPNGCTNPIRGTQCYCYEYDPVQEQWEKDFPVQFQKWNDDEHESIETPLDNPTFASKKCPFCRRMYDRDLHGSMTGYTKACVVCSEVRTHIKLPLCEHFVCTVCARKIYNGSDGEFNISTAIANGPPCPNGCANPPRGRQCECYAHIELVEKWMQTESAEVEMYKVMNDASVEFGEQGGVYNSQTCPVCRAEGGSWYKEETPGV